MAGSEWTERIIVVDRYLDAQYALMHAATGGEPAAIITPRLDAVRRLRVAFTQFPPNIFEEAVKFSSEAVNEAIVFLERCLKVRQNETLLLDWLAVFEFEGPAAAIERQLGITADPENDIYVLGGTDAQQIEAELKSRGYQRLLPIDQIRTKNLLVDDTADPLDNELLDNALRQLPDIISVRPERIQMLGHDGAVDSRVLSQIDSRLKLLYVGRNTTELMAKLWTAQLIKNTPALVRQGRSLLDLKDALKGRSAVVIGAGPSLDELLPRLKALETQLVFIVAFKALKSVIAAGIKPDFVVCLDPKQKTRHLEGVDLSQVGCFLVEAACEDQMVAALESRPLLPFVASDLTIELVREMKFLDLTLVGTAGSAVHAAVQFAVVFGCDRVYLAGTDFGFPQNRLYAEGAGTGDQFVVSADGQSYARQPLDSHYRAGSLTPVAANDGRVVSASLEMIKFREWVERFVRQHQDAGSGVQFLNLCKEGAVIAGAPYIDNLDLVAASSVKPLIADLLRASRPVAKVKAREFPQKLRRRMERIRELRDSCSDVLERSRKGLDYSREIARVQADSQKVIEVSTIINDKLMVLDEYAERIGERSQSESDQLLLGLIRNTRQAAVELLEVYAEIVAKLNAKV